MATPFKDIVIATLLRPSDSSPCHITQMSRGGREDLGLLDMGVPRLGAQPLCFGGRGFPGPALNKLVGIIRGGQATLGVLPPPIGNYLAEVPKKPPSKRLWTGLLSCWFVLQNFVPCCLISDVVKPNFKELLGDCSSCCCNFG